MSSYTPEDIALEFGATVRNSDGSVFNAAKRKGGYQLPTQQSPVPVDPMVMVLQKMAELLARPAPALEIPAPVVHVQPAAPAEKPVLDWTFDFIRNADGTIKSIRAVATQRGNP